MRAFEISTSSTNSLTIKQQVGQMISLTFATLLSVFMLAAILNKNHIDLAIVEAFLSLSSYSNSNSWALSYEVHREVFKNWLNFWQKQYKAQKQLMKPVSNECNKRIVDDMAENGHSALSVTYMMNWIVHCSE